MPIASAPIIGGIISGAGSILGGVMGGNAAGDAASAQANAATQAAAMQANSAQQALNFEKQVYGTQQQELNPYLQAGYGGLANLQSLLGNHPRGNAVQAGGGGMGGPGGADGGGGAAGPRYTSGDYKGGLFGSWGGSDWRYAGQKGIQDIYTRTNGSPAWDAYGPGGWSRGGAGTYTGFDPGTTPGAGGAGGMGGMARSNFQRAPGGGET